MSITADHHPISPAAQLMAIEVISELLISTSPQKLCEALTDHLRELSGARTAIVLAHRPEPNHHELLHVSPLRRAGLFSPTELNLFCFEQSPGELPFTPDRLSEHHPLKSVLVKAAIRSMLRFSLFAGGKHVGLLLLFDLPGEDRIEETNQIITLLAPPIALALKNALAFARTEQLAAELEHRVELRTEELRVKNVELSQSEEKFRSYVDASPDGVFVTDENGRYLEVNMAIAKITGYQKSELLNMSIPDLLPPEEAETALKHFQHLLETGVSSSEYQFLHKNGKKRWWLVDAVKLSDSRFLGLTKDITERKQADEDKLKLEAQLHQAQKMESVGRLAGGVAHDFNNMLTVILGHAQLGLMRLDPTHPVCDDLQEISKTAERSADLTRQLLAFARKQTVTPKVLDLNDTVSEMLKMLQRLIGENIQLCWRPAHELWQIRMDPSQIDQILANLCVNARDAIEETGRISIETQNRTVDAEYSATNLEAVPGEYVCLTVSDSGSGMDQETQDHIFEPFYTTKERGKGTGLGLATVYGAVKQNNGFINIYSEPGQGTTFSIYLPRDESIRSIQTLSETAALPVPRGQETILLVEDEPAILNIASMMLEKQGYTVLKAGSPGEAVRLAREHSGEIQLLMTDVIMPEMNGRDLAKNLLSLYPQMKRLFMSGYTSDVIAHHGVLDEGVCFIQKPFSLPNMAAKVREVLDKP
ncbi:MAG: PAS domain S-box protein [Desulfuromonadaceae bacterium]|nr:PAS domain S-box protein [Desulfuromonadaceae bacterium]